MCVFVVCCVVMFCVMCVACCGVVFVRMGVVCSLACDGLCVGTCFACGCGSARAAGGMRAHLGFALPCMTVCGVNDQHVDRYVAGQ